MESNNTKPNTTGTTATAPRGGQSFGNRGGMRGGRPGGSRFAPKPKPEYDQKIVDIRRVTRVVSGGRRFSFSVVIALGNRKGKVGVGIGKAGDTSLAINKAINDAKKRMITVPISKAESIKRDTEAKYGSSRVVMKSAPGKGLVAGSAVRTILDLAGIKNANAKILSRSKNKFNIAKAAIEALKKIS